MTHKERQERRDLAMRIAQEKSVEEAAKQTGLSERHIYNLCKENLLLVQRYNYHKDSFRQAQIGIMLYKGEDPDKIAAKFQLGRQYIMAVRKALLVNGWIEAT